MTVIVEGGKLTAEEIRSYQDYISNMYVSQKIVLLKIILSGENVDFEIHLESVEKIRIKRRIEPQNVVDYTHTVSGLIDE